MTSKLQRYGFLFGEWFAERLASRARAPGQRKNRERILVTRFDALGDLILTIPFLKALKGGRPQAELTVVVNKHFVDLLADCPYIDVLVGLDVRQRRWGRPIFFGKLLLALWSKRLGVFYEHLVIAKVDGPCDYEAMLSLALLPKKKYFHQNTSAFGLPITTWFPNHYSTVMQRPTGLHEVYANQLPLQEIGINVASEATLAAFLSENDRAAARRELAPLAQSFAKIVAVAIGARLPSRRWPTEHFLELCKRLLNDQRVAIVFVGGPDDISAANFLRARLPSDRTLNQCQSGGLCLTQAIIAQTTLFIGNDSGPKHLAAAVKVPVIEISCHPISASIDHQYSPARFAAFGVKSTVLRPAHFSGSCLSYCRAASAHCITAVTPAAVMAAAAEFLL